MATYEQWNKALLDYILSGLSQGVRVFLAVDDEVIEFLAGQLNTSPEDFAAAVRIRCLRSGDVDLHRVYSRSISSENYADAPRYLAFLSLMVLAAHNMGKEIDQGVAKNNYFYYFNTLLGLQPEGGRPPGMIHGSEVALWKDWSIWLRYHGFQATASLNVEHYYEIALSQALLRQSDKDSLWHQFSSCENRYPDDMSKDRLVLQLKHDAAYSLTHHLRILLNEEGKIGAQRYDDLANEIYEVFDAWIESGKQRERTRPSRGVFRKALTSGLYRVVDFLSREAQYYMLPRQPRHIMLSNASVEYQGQSVQLIDQRPGWFEPLPWPLTINEVAHGLQASITNGGSIHNLIVPSRDFWILPPDPDDSASRIYASWSDRPELGIPFVLLCKKELEVELKQLKEDGLIDWRGTPRSVESDWLEFEQMVVIGDAWSAATGEYKDLIGQLRPRSTTSISVFGGLRDPQTGEWLSGHGPDFAIHSFYENVHIKILTTMEEKPLKDFEVKAGETIHYDWSEPGNYQIQVISGPETFERRVTILDWIALSVNKSITRQPILVGPIKLWGAWVDEVGGS